MTTANNLASLGSTGVSTGFKNRIINGDMRIAQRGVGPTAGNNYTTLDRWKFYQVGSTGAYTSAQVTDAPAGFSHSLKLTVTASQASLGSTDYFSVNQIIEGVNTSDLNWGTSNAQAVTVSFWVKSSVAGTFSSGIQSCDGAFAVYQTTVSIPVANTWTRISYTIPGATISSWAAGTTSASVFFYIGLGNGSTYSTSTVNSWITGNYFGLTGQTSLVATNGATFYITGVQLEVGTTATNFDYRSYGTELALCQRYYWQGGNGSPGIFNGPSTARYSTILPVTMRATPTTTAIAAPIIINPQVAEQQTGSQTTGFSVTGYGASVNYSVSQIQFGGFSSGTDGRVTTLLNTALQFSAEL